MTHTPRVRQFEQLEVRSYLSSVGWDGPGQGSAELTYYIGAAPSYLSQTQVEDTLEKALDTWADVVDIVFTKTSIPNQRDSIDFEFTRIDGAGGTLAQAYLPDDVNRSRIAGDVQFDSSETWEIGNSLGSRAFDLLLVAVHEIGHALGIDHSRASGSVMAASVSPRQWFTELSADNVDAALELYAAAAPNDADLVDPTNAPTDTTTSANPPTSDNGDSNEPQRRHRWSFGGFNWTNGFQRRGRFSERFIARPNQSTEATISAGDTDATISAGDDESEIWASFRRFRRFRHDWA